MYEHFLHSDTKNANINQNYIFQKKCTTPSYCTFNIFQENKTTLNDGNCNSKCRNAGKNSCPLNIKLNFLSEYIEVSVEYEKHCFIFLFD